MIDLVNKLILNPFDNCGFITHIKQKLVFLLGVAVSISGDSGTRATRAEPELQNDDRGDSGTRATRAEPKLRNDGRLVII